MSLKSIFSLKIDENRVFGLDILRALAILFVFIEHSANILPKKIFQILAILNIDGVAIFFVLSGFLIGGILIKNFHNKQFSLQNILQFWIRRWFRTLPTYYFFVIIIAIFSKFFVIGFPLKAVIPNLFFLQNFKNVSFAFFGESWSLSVEEWFYLSIPVILLLLSFFIKNYKSLFFLLILIFIIYGISIRSWCYYNTDLHAFGDYRRAVIFRIDNLVYGVLGAYCQYWHTDKWKKYKIPALWTGLFLIIVWKIIFENNNDIYTFSYSNIYFPLISISVLFLLPYFSELKKIKSHAIFYDTITYLSLISYSLYLIHYSLMNKIIIHQILEKQLFPNTNIVFLKNIIYWLGSLSLALLSYKFIEIPSTKLRDKLKIS